MDIAIGSFGEIPARIKSQSLFRETMVWVARDSHPLAATKPSSRTLAAQPCIAVVVDYPFRLLRSDGAGDRMTRPAIIGGIEGLTRHSIGNQARARVFDLDTAAAMAGQTDLVAALPRRFALALAGKEGLHIFKTPVDRYDIEIVMLWHGRFGEDPGLSLATRAHRRSIDGRSLLTASGCLPNTIGRHPNPPRIVMRENRRKRPDCNSLSTNLPTLEALCRADNFAPKSKTYRLFIGLHQAVWAAR